MKRWLVYYWSGGDLCMSEVLAESADDAMERFPDAYRAEEWKLADHVADVTDRAKRYLKHPPANFPDGVALIRELLAIAANSQPKI